VAPPTDAELSQMLGGSSSKNTKHNSNSHDHNSGYSRPQQRLSPNGSTLVPPQDVQIAIALSKIGKNGEGSSPRTVDKVKKEIANRYSLGSELPKGTSWRYVNVMEENGK
jgi:hypothetical protein